MDWKVTFEKTWNHRVEATFWCDVEDSESPGVMDRMFDEFWLRVAEDLLPYGKFGTWNVLWCDLQLDQGGVSVTLWDRNWEKGDYLGSMVVLTIRDLWRRTDEIALSDDYDCDQAADRIEELTQPYLQAMIQAAGRSPAMRRRFPSVEIWFWEHDTDGPQTMMRLG